MLCISPGLWYLDADVAPSERVLFETIYTMLHVLFVCYQLMHFLQVGDLPDADVAPPENVLFVCKLNPVTTDEDLEIIFSRFGPIVKWVNLMASIVPQKKATINQVTTMVATAKNVLFPCHSHILTTGTDNFAPVHTSGIGHRSDVLEALSGS